jgi:exo-1,4-beta-D-glucosaminidase
VALAIILALAARAETLTLSKGWQVQSSAKVMTTGDVLSTPAANVAGWYEATVPSTIMGVLTADGVEPEALTAEDYQRIDKKRFDVSWWYRTTFSLQQRSKVKGQRSKDHVLLSFDGICYRANIWLNGHLVAGKDDVAGTYRQFTFDVTPYVREQNVLAVEVFRAQPGEPNIGFVDWNPRPADESMGIFREVKVKTCGDVSVSHSSVRSRVNTETQQEAWLTIDAELTNLTGKTVKGVLRGTFDGRLLTTSVTLAPHERRLVTLAEDAHVEKPRLWWCHTLGKPELYDLQMEFEQGGAVSDAENVRFGIRDIKSHLTPEGYRVYTLNGRDVLLRGAGWTDDIYLRDTPERNRQQLEYVRDMNMNTVRLEGFWGTSQSIYDLCDELGLFLLAGWSCHWEWEEYLGAPCDPHFGGITSEENIQLISESFADQMLWLRHHPSIIAWFLGSDRLPVPALEQRYRDFLATCDDRPVVISAKQMESTISGLSGSKMEGPYDYVAPAYWYDPQAPGGAFGFNTETGVGAQLPVRESLQKMLRSTQLWPIDKRWNILCTASSSEMNTLAKLTEVIDARFGASKTIDEYLHRADLLSYEGTKVMFEAFRVNAKSHSDLQAREHGIATGIIQWMLNSARPSVYWQLYDYYLQPNAAYYAVKRGNQPVQLIYDYQRRAVFAVNETQQDVTLNVAMRLIAGATDKQEQKTLSLEAGAVVKAFDISVTSDAFLFLKASDRAGAEIAVNDYFLPSERDVYDWEKTNWVTTPITRYASYRALNNLPRVTCQLTSKPLTCESNVQWSMFNGQCFELTITNPSSTVAFFQRLMVKDAKGTLVCPAYWSDNYVTLAPGESRTITCMLPITDKNAKVHFEVEGF